jgi:CO/xanthine dehydrogenase Mo-binding subunit
MSEMKLPGPLMSASKISDWIRFEDSQRVRVLSGRVELGQGNMTALLQIAAEELDVDPARVSITGADTAQTPNEGFTSSSMSISVGGVSVRLAASAARHVLLDEAAGLLQSSKDVLSIVDGKILRDGVDADLDLWQLAQSVDLDASIAEHADPKPPEQRHIVGKSLPRIDLEQRIVGLPFVHDLVFEGMLHGRPIHPPSLTSQLVSLDLDGLKTRPGVVALVRNGSFAGVVAESEYAAILAARWAVNRAEWSDTAQSPDDPIEAIKASTEPFDVVHEAGDMASAKGDIFETTISRPYLGHGSIGPSAAVAQWADDRLTVWTHAQGPYPLRAALDQVFGIGEDRITVTHRMGAGCYGHNGADDVALDAALLARSVPGRPVMVVWSRANEFQCAPLGPGMATRIRAVLGTSEDGERRIASMEVAVNSAPHGNRPGRNGAPNLRASAYLETPFPPPRSADIPLSNGGGADRNSVPLYAIPNLHVTKRLVHDLPYRTSSLRGLGGYANIYAIETLMDEIAHEIGEDPIAFRLRHLDDSRARAVIERVAVAARGILDEKMPDGASWGIGFGQYKNTAAYCAIIARIELGEELRVSHVHACLDTGEAINPDGVINQTEGGILQSMSWTLKEALKFEGTAVATQNWDDYPILKFSEVPELDVQLIDRPDTPPLGCAEAAQGPMAAALGNALRNVIGTHVRDLPLTRDAIIRAMS